MRGRRPKESVSHASVYVGLDLSWLTVLPAALITISTRASLKRYHTYSLTLGIPTETLGSPLPDEESSSSIAGQSYGYSLQRIGTTSEKQSVAKELVELRERLSRVDGWKKRRQEIDEELSQVLTGAGESIPPPAYQESGIA